MTRTPALLLSVLILVAACSTTGSEPEPETYVGVSERDPPPVGKWLGDLDLKMRAWSRLTMTAANEREQREARGLADILELETRKRMGELVIELESGPPRNRQRAAAALGFTNDPGALRPLLGALEDPDLDVVHNALLGLALLADPATPTEAIAALMADHPDAATRSNAAYALRSVVEAGVDPQPLVPAVRLALSDPEPGVRLQAALIAGLAADGESVQRLADLLHNDEALVRMAAIEGLVLIGKRSGRDKGAAARALVDAWLDADSDLGARLRVAMAELAGKDLGSDEERWFEWSRNLP